MSLCSWLCPSSLLGCKEKGARRQVFALLCLACCLRNEKEELDKNREEMKGKEE